MVLVGAMLIFGERLNLYQWIGVMLAILSFFMLSRSGKKEGIDFKHNKWIYFIVLLPSPELSVDFMTSIREAIQPYGGAIVV